LKIVELIFLGFILSAFGLISCDELPCVEKKKVQVGIDFIKDTTVPNFKTFFSYKSLTIKTNDRILSSTSDSILAKLQSPKQKLNVQVPIDAKYLKLIFLNSDSKDSIQFQLISTPLFISEACGYQKQYNISAIESFGGNHFKKNEILNVRIDTSSKSHVQILL